MPTHTIYPMCTWTEEIRGSFINLSDFPQARSLRNYPAGTGKPNSKGSISCCIGELALRLCHDCTGEAVSDHIDGRASHVDQSVDS